MRTLVQLATTTLLTGVAIAQPAGCYELTPDARLELTCFAPCECPAPPDATLTGTFDLQYVYAGSATSLFRVNDIDLTVDDGGVTGITTIKGFGMQRQFIAGANEIFLDSRFLLSIDDAPPRLFESRNGARGSLSADFFATIADNGFICDNTQLILNAQFTNDACPTPTTCDCDLTTDGTAAIDDLLVYLDLWFEQDILAERTFSLAIEIDDLLDFLDCWLDARAGSCD